MRPLLIRRHTLTVARGRWVWPDRLFSCTDTGWTWPGVAQYLPPLAPRLAPHNPANLRPGAPRCGPVSSGASASRARLRHPGNQARDCPRPKVATPGRDRPTLSTAAPVRRRRSPSHVGRGPDGELAAFTARHDEVTPGAGPLRPIPVRPQVALPALRALLDARPLTETHQHTVTRHRAGFTLPRPLAAPVGHSPMPFSLF